MEAPQPPPPPPPPTQPSNSATSSFHPHIFVLHFSTKTVGKETKVHKNNNQIPWGGSKETSISTILLGTRKMVRIGSIGLALSDPHFCILSRDCFNLSREYFSLWAIKTSLDRNASAVLDPEVLFSRVARHLACLAFCKLQVGIFQRSVLFID